MRFKKAAFIFIAFMSQNLAFAYDGDPFPDCKDVGIKPASLYEPLSAWFDRVRNYHENGYIPDTYYELFIGCEKSFVQCFYTLDGSSEIQCASTSPGFDNHLKKIPTFLSINGVCEKLQIGNAKHAGSSYLLCPYALGRK
jgi:hypothetical protein